MQPRNPEVSIAHRLRIAREDNTGLTQEQFAKASGISRSTVTRYEDTRYVAERNALYLRTWAEFCSVTLAWLQTGTDQDGPTDGGQRTTGRYTAPLRMVREHAPALTTSSDRIAA